MRSRLMLWFAVGVIVVILGIVAATLLFTPEETNPAFANAIAFVDAAMLDDDATATSYLSQELRDYVSATCPDGSVSACLHSYIPDEWGAFRDIGFRRAAPDGDGWNVDLIGYWEQGRGFSGVCVYTEMRQEEGQWRVHRWAGFAWCGDPATRSMATNPDAPNRAP